MAESYKSYNEQIQFGIYYEIKQDNVKVAYRTIVCQDGKGTSLNIFRNVLIIANNKEKYS